MAKKFINQTHIEGILYQHDLKLKVSGENSKAPGTEYITGNIELATDNDITNIVPVHFTYVTATTAQGKPNSTFTMLKNIIDKFYKTYMEDGADKATKMRVDSAIGLNEFYTDRNGKEELVSAKRNEGGFIHVVTELDQNENARNTFNVDMIINNVHHIDANEETGAPEKAIVKGTIFNFRGELLPVEFSAIDPGAINYFENELEASPKTPVFTRVRGLQISESVVKHVEEESAFGGSYVRDYTSTKKDFVINWAAPEVYEWDDESTITVKELEEKISAREIALAELKKRNDDYKASKGQASTAAAPSNGGFNF